MTVPEVTLKQIMHNKLDELGRYTRCLTDAEIYECVREWLQQKQKEIGYEFIFNQLFEELEQ